VHRTVGGQDVGPQLSWSGFPAQTRSFAVTLFDPDTPSECGFWHWVLIDLPATTHDLPSGAGAPAWLPQGAIHTRNDFGNNRYDDSAPSAGDVAHRYVFMVHALDVETLDVPPSATGAMVSFNLAFHILARGVIRSTYQVT
jgi:Raf kinase inhibitor-like YbhB/YbcL family protein